MMGPSATPDFGRHGRRSPSLCAENHDGPATRVLACKLVAVEYGRQARALETDVDPLSLGSARAPGSVFKLLLY